MSAINNTTENYTVGNLSMKKLRYSHCATTYQSQNHSTRFRYIPLFSMGSQNALTQYLQNQIQIKTPCIVSFSSGMVLQWICRCRFLAISRNFCTFYVQFGNIAAINLIRYMHFSTREGCSILTEWRCSTAPRISMTSILESSTALCLPDAEAKTPLWADKPLRNMNANSKTNSAVDSGFTAYRGRLSEEQASMMVRLHFYPNAWIWRKKNRSQMEK